MMTDPAELDPEAPVAPVSRMAWREDRPWREPDHLAREEPLEIRIAGVPVAVLMRTPGHDEDLVRGFLLTERIATDPTAIAGIRYCTDIDDPAAENNVVQVALHHPVDLAALRRNMFTTSSCGVCGKASIEQALACAAPLDDDVTVSMQTLYALPERLRNEQVVFEQTGGLHAAGLFDATGRRRVIREDVGRHNAVDKVVGATCAEGGTVSPPILMVSGRVSFEIVQKALAARIPIVAAVSAPTSLACELARQVGLTLVAFVRGRRSSVYAAEHRIRE